MQRYRVNYTLLVGLLVGSVVAAGSLYGVWTWQMSGNAGELLERAKAEEQQGDLLEAAEILSDYLAFRPDDQEVRVKQGELYVEIGTEALEAQNFRLFSLAKETIGNTLFKYPNEDELRADLVEMLMAPNVQQFFAKDVLGHVKVLLSENPEDPDLLRKQATCLIILGESTEAAEVLYRMVGYDAATDTFSASQAIAPNDIDAYHMLSRVLLGRLERRELAMRLEDYMIETNPDSADAYLERGRFFAMIDEGEGSRNDYGEESSKDLQTAYELDPEKPETLLALAEEAQRKGDYDLTQEYLERGLELGTDIRIFYSGLGKLERHKGNHEAAIAQIERGLEAVDESQQPWLLLDKIDFQIDAGNLAGAEETIEEFERQVEIQHPYIEFYEARILAAKDDWVPAARALEEVQPKLAGNINMRTECDMLLGLAYDKNGYREKALEVFERLTRENPSNNFARAKRDDLARRLMGEAPTTAGSMNFSQRLAAEIDKPEAEQNWEAFDRFIEDYCETHGHSDVQRMLLETEVLSRRKMYDEARQLLSEAYKQAPDDMSVQRAAVRLLAMEPEQGPEAAMKQLDRIVEKFGDQWQLRLDRADMYLRMNRDTLAADLMSLTEGIEDWDRSKQIQLRKGIATRLARAGKREESEAAWKEVAKLDPNDLPTLMQVFEMALVRNDDAAMREAQQQVLDLVGSKSDPNWAFTEAARKFVEFRQDPGKDHLPGEIRELVETALEERPDWHAPYILRATLAMTTRDYLDALEDFREGFRRGRGTPQATAQYVRLLAAQGSFNEALELLDAYDPNVNVLLIDKLYPQLLFRVGRFNDAAEAATRIADASEDDAADQLWYGQFMQGMASVSEVPESLREDCQEKAGEALAKAVELAPGNPATWLAQVTQLLSVGDTAAAEDVVRRAQLMLEEDRQQMFLARCYEMMGRWFDAENTYRLAYEQNPEADSVARQLANFYLSQRYPRPDGREKATALINDILRRHAEDEDSVSRQNASWARRTAARMLAETGGYQNLLKAEKLLASNAVNGTLANEDKLQMAQILADRPEPVSRNKAIKLLEEVAAQQRLPKEMQLALGQLYFDSGNWPKCRDHMATLITNYPNDFDVRSAYIRMLLRRGGTSDLRRAEGSVRRLIEIAPRSPRTLELVSLVYSEMGEEDQARATLRRMLPENLNDLDADGYRLVARVAILMANTGDTATAEKLLATVANRPGATQADALQFAQFVGIHRDHQRGFDMLEQLAEDLPLPAIVDTAMKIVRDERSDAGDQYDETIDNWLTRAERDDPESVGVMLQRADFLELQGSYEQAAQLYRRILNTGELQGQGKAVVLNNLAYLLALGAAEPESPDEAVRLVEEAVEILGPIADILDTRAVIWIGRGEYQAAVDDLELAVTDRPTASKYFHKAIAHMGLKQNSEALEAWEKAVELGLTRDSVSALEQQQYDKMERPIEALRRRSERL